MGSHGAETLGRAGFVTLRHVPCTTEIPQLKCLGRVVPLAFSSAMPTCHLAEGDLGRVGHLALLAGRLGRAGELLLEGLALTCTHAVAGRVQTQREARLALQNCMQQHRAPALYATACGGPPWPPSPRPSHPAPRRCPALWLTALPQILQRVVDGRQRLGVHAVEPLGQPDRLEVLRRCKGGRRWEVGRQCTAQHVQFCGRELGWICSCLFGGPVIGWSPTANGVAAPGLWSGGTTDCACPLSWPHGYMRAPSTQRRSLTPCHLSAYNINLCREQNPAEPWQPLR